MPRLNRPMACRLACGAAVCLAMAVVPLSARGEVIDRIMAVVNGDVITLSDVAAARNVGLVSPPSGSDPTRGVLLALIDRVLELQEVNRYGPPEPGADAIDAQLREVRARFVSPAAFQMALDESGLDLQRLRDLLRDSLRIQAYVNERFAVAGARRQQLIDEWLAGLRRRAQIVDWSVTGR